MTFYRRFKKLIGFLMIMVPLCGLGGIYVFALWQSDPWSVVIALFVLAWFCIAVAMLDD